jgi:predicted adenylyl cyclase CyaB
MERMNDQLLRKTEHTLIELKSKAHDLGIIRNKLTELGAEKIGTFRQIDSYFEVPKGRLKLREVEGKNEAMLVYYERKNVAGPKRSSVFIVEIREPTVFEALLNKILKVKATVDKKREIYRYQGTQIHLDTVKDLGTFIEFEKETHTDTQAVNQSKQALGGLMEKLGINPNELEKLSYGDLIQKRQSRS